MMDHMPFSFNELVKRHRLAAGLTQRDVANAMAASGHDVTPQTVSGWESGTYRPRTLELVQSLEAAIGAEGDLTDSLGLNSVGETLLDVIESRLATIESELRSLLAEIRGES